MIFLSHNMDATGGFATVSLGFLVLASWRLASSPFLGQSRRAHRGVQFTLRDGCTKVMDVMAGG